MPPTRLASPMPPIPQWSACADHWGRVSAGVGVRAVGAELSAAAFDSHFDNR